MDTSIIEDSSDELDGYSKLSPDNFGSQRGWNALSLKNSIIYKIVKRHRQKWELFDRRRRHVRKVFSGVHSMKLPSATISGFNRLRSGQKVNIALNNFPHKTGTILKVVQKGIYKVQVEKGDTQYFPRAILQIVKDNCENERQVYNSHKVGDLVDVEKRTWAGINKEGGVARIISVNSPKYNTSSAAPQDDSDYDSDMDLNPTYDVKYVMGGSERRVAAKYLQPTDLIEREASKRSTQGRCAVENCGCFIIDCQHPQPEHNTEKLPGERVLEIAFKLGKVPITDDTLYWEKESVISSKITSHTISSSEDKKFLRKGVKKPKSNKLSVNRKHSKSTSKYRPKTRGTKRDKKDKRVRTEGVIIISDSEDSMDKSPFAHYEEDTFSEYGSDIDDDEAWEEDIGTQKTGLAAQDVISAPTHSVLEHNSSPLTSDLPICDDSVTVDKPISYYEQGSESRMVVGSEHPSGEHSGEKEEGSTKTCVQEGIGRVPSSTMSPLIEVRNAPISVAAIHIGRPVHEIRPSTSSGNGQSFQISEAQRPSTTSNAVQGNSLHVNSSSTSVVLSVARVTSETVTGVARNSDDNASAKLPDNLPSDSGHSAGWSQMTADVQRVSKPAKMQCKMTGLFTNSDINQEPRDLRPYLRAVLTNLSLEKTLEILKGRFDRLERYIGQCKDFRSNASVISRQFQELSGTAAIEDVEKEFIDECDRFESFKLKVQRKVVDVCNVIFKKITKKGDYDLLENRQMQLETEFNAIRKEVSDMHKSIGSGKLHDFALADSETDSDSDEDTSDDDEVSATYNRYSGDGKGQNTQSKGHTANLFGYVYSKTAGKKRHRPFESDLSDRDYEDNAEASDMIDFISSQDDIFGASKLPRSQYKSREVTGDIIVGSGQDSFPKGANVDSFASDYDYFIEDDVSTVKAKKRYGSNKDHRRYREKTSFLTDKYIEDIIDAMATGNVFGLSMDLMYSDDSIPIMIRCLKDGSVADEKHNVIMRNGAEATARNKISVLQASYDHDDCAAIAHVFSCLEELALAHDITADQKTTRHECFTYLFEAEYIWQHIALVDKEVCTFFLNQCCKLETDLLERCFRDTSSSENVFDAWFSELPAICLKQSAVVLFALVRRKSLWISMGLHYTAITKNESVARLLQMTANSVSLITNFGLLVFYKEVAALFGDALRVMRRNIRSVDADMCPEAEVLLENFYQKDVAASSSSVAFDILQSTINTSHTYFADYHQLASSCRCGSDIAKSSKLRKDKWSSFNYISFNIQDCLSNSSSIQNCVSSLGSFLVRASRCAGETEPNVSMAMSNSGGSSSLSSQGQEVLANAIWVGIVLNTYAIYSTGPIIPKHPATNVSITANWVTLRSLTESIFDTVLLRTWMSRITLFLSLWDSTSQACDLFQSLVSRLVKDLPWSEKSLLSSIRDRKSEEFSYPTRAITELEKGAIEAVSRMKQYHLEHHVVSIATMDYLIDAMYIALEESPPLRGDWKQGTRSVDFGHSMIPAISNFFEKGPRHMLQSGAAYRRAQNRMNKIILDFLKDSSHIRYSPSLVLFFIEYIASACRKYGSDFYHKNLHDAITNAIGNCTEILPHFKVLISFVTIFNFLLPIHVKQELSSTNSGINFSDNTSLTQLAGAFIRNTLNTLLIEAAQGVGAERMASNLERSSCLLCLITCYEMLDGVRMRGFVDSDFDSVNIIVLWCMQAINPGFYSSKAASLEGAYLNMSVELLYDLLSQYYHHTLTSNSKSERIASLLVSSYRNIIATFRSIFSDLVALCQSQKHEFKTKRAWRNAIFMTKSLASIFFIVGRTMHASSIEIAETLSHLLQLFNSLSVSDGEYPHEIWLRATFWGNILPSFCLLERDNSDPQSATLKNTFLKAIGNFPDIFCVWIGCLGSLYAEPTIRGDICFQDLHRSVLSENFLRSTNTGKNFIAESCIRVLTLNSYSPSCISGFSMSECMLCLHHVLLSCSVGAEAKPTTERRNIKAAYKPIREVLERCVEYVKVRCLYSPKADRAMLHKALHTLLGVLLADDMSSISEVDAMSRTFTEVHEAYLVESSQFFEKLSANKQKRLKSPTSNSVQFTLCFPSYFAAAASCPFTTQFSSWKPYLRLLVRSRTDGNYQTRVFYTRLCSLSLFLIGEDDKEKYCDLFQEMVPLQWKEWCYSGVDKLPTVFIASHTIATAELASVAHLPLEEQMDSTATLVAMEYNNYDKQREGRMFGFRKHLLLSDDVWDTAYLGMQQIQGLFEVDLISCRIEFIVDWCRVLTALYKTDKEFDAKKVKAKDVDMLRMLSYPLLLVSHILCIRLLLVLLGSSMGTVMGTVTEDIGTASDTLIKSIKICWKALTFSKKCSSTETFPVSTEILSVWARTIGTVLGPLIASRSFIQKEEVESMLVSSDSLAISLSGMHLGDQINREWSRVLSFLQEKISGVGGSELRFLSLTSRQMSYVKALLDSIRTNC